MFTKLCVTCVNRIRFVLVKRTQTQGCGLVSVFRNAALQQRYYTMGGDRRSGNIKRPSSKIDPSAFKRIFNVEEFVDKLDTRLAELKEDFVKQLSLRTNTQAFDSLSVKMRNGSIALLGTITQVTMKTPSMAVANMSHDTGSIGAVMEAIMSSGLNVVPSVEGSIINIPIPKITREHREKLVRSAKYLVTKYTEQVRSVQAPYHRLIQASDCSEDLRKLAQVYLETTIKKYIEDGNVLLKTKEKELMSSS